MKRTLYLILLFIWGMVTISAREQQVPDSICSCLLEQVKQFPQEKVHVHTDRSTFMAGETMWWRAFLVDAVSNRLFAASRYLYAELINPFNKVVSRVKVRCEEGYYFYGHLDLDETLPGGDYTLRVYTRYMENMDEGYFFRKPIRIISPFANAFQFEASLEGGIDSKTLVAKINLIETATGKKQTPEDIAIRNRDELLEHWVKDESICVRVNNTPFVNNPLLVSYGNFKQYLLIRQDEQDYHVDFFPEGGNLLAGTLCRIAFKAINKDGLSEAITGIVTDENGKELRAFESFHRGMGVFSLIPEVGKKYVVRCWNTNGLIREYKLPEAKENSYTLKVNEVKDRLYISVLRSANMPQTDSLQLIVHQKGIPVYADWLKEGKLDIGLQKALLSFGTAHALLVDSYGQIISERLFFLMNDEPVMAGVSADKPYYGEKEWINLDIRLTDRDHNLVEGDFSIAVTDDRDVAVDSCFTIYSTLLLSSELKGYIEDPAWYFRNKDSEALDVLMMTQGWRRYNIPEVIKGHCQIPSVLPEESQQLSGSIKSLVLRKPVKEGVVRIWAPEAKMVEEVKSDSTGNFCLRNFEFPDSTRYMVYAISGKGKEGILLNLDKEQFPVVTYPFPMISDQWGNESDQEELSGYLDKARKRINQEKGIHILLDEVVVTAQKVKKRTPYQSSINTRSISEDDIKESGIENVGTLIAAKGGVMNSGGDIYIRGVKAAFVFDDMPIYDSDQARMIINTVRKEDIEQIDIVKSDLEANFFFPGIGPFVAITTKRGIGITYDYTPKNIGRIQLLGYQEPVEFYSPCYEVDVQPELPDMRSTIYWNPVVKTGQDGKATVSFYSSGTPSVYSVVIEGVTREGKIFRTTQQISVKSR